MRNSPMADCIPLPGEGELPLRGFVAALPADTMLSVEVPRPAGSRFSTTGWVRHVTHTTRAYLDDEADPI